MIENLKSFSLLWTVVVLAFGGNFHYGYQISIVNPTKVVFEQFMNESAWIHYDRAMTDYEYRILWSLMINILVIGAVLSIPLVPLLADNIGRRGAMAVASFLIIGATIPMVAAKQIVSYQLIAISRLFYGLACGLTAGVNSLYIQEISSRQNRGLLSAITGLFVELGFGASAVTGLPLVFGTQEDWPKIFYVELIPTVIVLVTIPFFPESPKYLLSQGKREAAVRSVEMYEKDPNSVLATMREIEEEIAHESQALGILDVLRNREYRKGVLLGCLISFVAEFCGITAVDSFTTYFMMTAGFSHPQAAGGNILVAFCSICAGISGILIIDKYGRRPLLIYSGIGLLLVNTAFLITFKTMESSGPFDSAPYILLTASCLFMILISMSWGPIEWFIVGELVPQNARSAATALSHLSLYLSVFTAGALYLPLEGVIGAWTFLIFIIPLALGTGIVAWQLPETKNRPIMEIVAELNKNRPDTKNGLIKDNYGTGQ